MARNFYEGPSIQTVIRLVFILVWSLLFAPTIGYAVASMVLRAIRADVYDVFEGGEVSLVVYLLIWVSLILVLGLRGKLPGTAVVFPNCVPSEECVGCGYDLLGNTTGICPECGALQTSFCTRCGFYSKDEQPVTCPECGTSFNKETA